MNSKINLSELKPDPKLPKRIIDSFYIEDRRVAHPYRTYKLEELPSDLQEAVHDMPDWEEDFEQYHRIKETYFGRMNDSRHGLFWYLPSPKQSKSQIQDPWGLVDDLSFYSQFRTLDLDWDTIWDYVSDEFKNDEVLKPIKSKPWWNLAGAGLGFSHLPLDTPLKIFFYGTCLDESVSEFPLLSYISHGSIDCLLAHRSLIALFDEAAHGHIAVKPVELISGGGDAYLTDYVLLDILSDEREFFDYSRTEVGWFKEFGRYRPHRIADFTIADELENGPSVFRHQSVTTQIFMRKSFAKKLDRVLDVGEVPFRPSENIHWQGDDELKRIVFRRDHCPIVWWRGGSFMDRFQ